MPNIRAFKVGGLRFIRIGQLQLSICRVRPKVTLSMHWIAGQRILVRTVR